MRCQSVVLIPFFDSGETTEKAIPKLGSGTTRGGRSCKSIYAAKYLVVVVLQILVDRLAPVLVDEHERHIVVIVMVGNLQFSGRQRADVHVIAVRRVHKFAFARDDHLSQNVVLLLVRIARTLASGHLSVIHGAILDVHKGHQAARSGSPAVGQTLEKV